ncbi:MAG: hypothetical protein ACOZQL_28620 [Myxococcota bacterium]
MAAVGGGAAPYQEKVFGWMEYPPTANHWSSTAFAYPRLQDVGGNSSPNTLPEPSCATPTSCASTRPTHVSSCFGLDAGSGGGQGGGAGATGGGGGGAAGGGTGMDAGPPIGGGVGTDAGGEDAGEAVSDGGVRQKTGAVGGCGCRAIDAPLVALISLLRRGRRRR